MLDALAKKTRELLLSVANSTVPEAGVAFLSTKAAGTAVTAGHLEANTGMKNDKNLFAHRLTDAGRKFLADTQADADADAAASPSQPTGSAPSTPLTNVLKGGHGEFARKAIVIPETNRALNRKSGYPTDELIAPYIDPESGKTINDGFFIPPKDGTDASKAYPAVATAATKRFKKLFEDGKTDVAREFTARNMDGGAFDEKFAGKMGVGIFRTK